MESEDLQEMLANRNKTGSTEGNDAMTSPDSQERLPTNEEMLRLVASAERGSEHPLAKVGTV